MEAFAEEQLSLVLLVLSGHVVAARADGCSRTARQSPACAGDGRRRVEPGASSRSRSAATARQAARSSGSPPLRTRGRLQRTRRGARICVLHCGAARQAERRAWRGLAQCVLRVVSGSCARVMQSASSSAMLCSRAESASMRHRAVVRRGDRGRERRRQAANAPPSLGPGPPSDPTNGSKR